MPAIVALRDLLSLHATTQLIHGGYRAQWGAPGTNALTLTGATNASPIVVTTATPHGVRSGTVAHVVIAGVVGNTAANNLDTATPQQSSTSGMNRAWSAVSTGEYTLALYSVDPGTGQRVASTGSAAYVSGGTISKAFTDGLVLLGRRWVFTHGFPPRVVMIPKGSTFDAKNVADPRIASAESLRMRASRSIRSDVRRFEVQCWGVGEMGAATRDPDVDYTATEILYEQMIRSAHLLGAGVYDLDGGEWADDVDGETQVLKTGHEFTFGLSFGTPITDRALEQAPEGVGPIVTTQLLVPGAVTPETGCSDA